MKIGWGLSELWGSKIALSHWLGTWLIQQLVLPYKPWYSVVTRTSWCWLPEVPVATKLASITTEILARWHDIYCLQLVGNIQQCSAIELLCEIWNWCKTRPKWYAARRPLHAWLWLPGGRCRLRVGRIADKPNSGQSIRVLESSS